MAGKADASELYRLLVTDDEDERMPYEADPLPAEQITTIRKWIEQGAAFDGPAADKPLASFVESSQGTKAPAVYPQRLPVTSLAFAAGKTGPVRKRVSRGHTMGRDDGQPSRSYRGADPACADDRRQPAWRSAGGGRRYAGRQRRDARHRSGRWVAAEVP